LAEEVLLEQGINLMILGMGTVFVFLTALVLATMLMSTVLVRLYGEDEPAVQHAEVSEEVVAAVSATLRHHRSRAANK